VAPPPRQAHNPRSSTVLATWERMQRTAVLLSVAMRCLDPRDRCTGVFANRASCPGLGSGFVSSPRKRRGTCRALDRLTGGRVFAAAERSRPHPTSATRPRCFEVGVATQHLGSEAPRPPPPPPPRWPPVLASCRVCGCPMSLGHAGCTNRCSLRRARLLTWPRALSNLCDRGPRTATQSAGLHLACCL